MTNISCVSNGISDLLRVVRCCHGQSHIIHKCQSIINNVANGLTRLIHGPSINGHIDYFSLTINGPSMDGHLASRGVPPPLHLSIRGCQSCCVICGASIDGQLASPPLSKYPWMPELLCHLWTIHG